MKTKEFLAEAAELVRLQLPSELRGTRVIGPMGPLIKLHYGDPKVHYEVWVRRRAEEIEVGLHFEGAPGDNARYLSELTTAHAESLASLGSEVEAGSWVNSWTRVHRSFPFGTLDENLLMGVSGCLCQMMRTLQPPVWDMCDAPAGASQRIVRKAPVSLRG